MDRLAGSRKDRKMDLGCGELGGNSRISSDSSSSVVFFGRRLADRKQTIPALLVLMVSFSLLCLCMPANVLAETNRAGEQARSLQSVQASFPVFYLVPDTTTSVQLQTHTADFQIVDAGDGSLIVSFEGLYRFKNDGKDPVALPLNFVSEGSGGSMPSVTLTVDGTPVPVDSTEEGYQVELRVGADTSLAVRLTYSAPLDAAPLALLRYDIRDLVAWPGSSSLRTTITMPEKIEPASWINVAPDGWNYATPSDPQNIGIHWLYDGDFPQSPFLFQFVTPETWQRISALSAASRTDPAATIELGDLYQQIYGDLPGDGFSETRERFYAQALAVYLAGIETGTANGLPVAGLQAGLAALYRGRILEAGADPDPGYLTLMVETTTDALAGLPADDGRRAELQQWQADGLRQLLAEAQQEGKWPTVLALLGEMEALPQPPLSLDALAETRRAATVLQALELLESGQRDAAIALAGDEVVAEALRPGPELQSLFAGWQVTATVATDGIELTLVGLPAPGQLASARVAMDEQLDRWQSMPTRSKASIRLDEVLVAPGDEALRLQMSIPDREASLTLAQAMSPGPDWALLHDLLEQIAPLVRTQAGLLRREVTIEQTFDLRGAGIAWASMAENLESQAIVFESAGLGINPGDPAAVEAALLARIQAANFRTASHEWRNLASNSWVTTALSASQSDSVDGAGGESARSWLATVDMPIQTYSLQAETLNPLRALIAGLMLLGLLLFFSGLLWRLL